MENSYRDVSEWIACIERLEAGRAAMRARKLARRRMRRVLLWSLPPLLVILLLMPFVVIVGAWQTPKSEISRRDARELYRLVGSWRADHGNACPSLEELVRRKQLEPSTNVDDPWGNPYKIRCEDVDDTVITGAGADGYFGTSDDIAIPDR